MSAKPSRISQKRIRRLAPPPQPFSKRKRQDTLQQRAQQVIEIRQLLLNKVNSHIPTNDDSLVDKVLSEEYSPRIVQLLHSIAKGVEPTFEKENTHANLDGISKDAVVPCFDALVPSNDLTNEAVVPRRTSSHMLLVPSAEGSITVPTDTIASVPTLNNQKATPAKPEHAAVYNKDTEIAISRIFSLGKVATVADPSIPVHAPYQGPSVITMTGFGELGRWGNQVLQYVFLKCYAARYGIVEIQVPSWVGASLFGFEDRPVQRAFPPVVEFRGTLANSTFTTEFIDYVKRSNADSNVPELNYDILDTTMVDLNEGYKNVDIWGWFQWHTSHFRAYKSLIQSTFSPIPVVSSHMNNIFDQRIRYKGGVKRTVVGLHLRLGDYQNIAASSFGYCAPTDWYLEWLQKIWPTLENPVLFVASDDINAVLTDFADYDPITADSVGLSLPEEMKGTKAGFFPDWFSLTQCDVLAISNSTFSFSACMMNQQANLRCFRAHYLGEMIEFDPWNSDPIIHRDMSRNGLAQAIETLQVLYNTQGSKGVARNLFYELPYYGLRAAVMKAVLWKQSYVKQLQVA